MLQETVSAVDRIDNEHALAAKAVRIVLGFFRQPSIVRAFAQQCTLEIAINLDIGFGHWIAARFVPAFARSAVIAPGNVAGLPQ